MNLLETIQGRRSCRKYQKKAVDQKTIDQLLKATFTAPSSKNCRSTRFAVVRDRAVIEKIALMRSSGSAFVAEAPLAVVVMGDVTLTDLWRENCAISAATMMYAAQALGLGSCWVHVHGRPHDAENPGGKTAESYLRGVIEVPDKYGILCLVALGYPEGEMPPHKEVDDSDKVIYVG